jgi:hypothetical protein
MMKKRDRERNYLGSRRITPLLLHAAVPDLGSPPRRRPGSDPLHAGCPRILAPVAWPPARGGWWSRWVTACANSVCCVNSKVDRSGNRCCDANQREERHCTHDLGV